MICFYLVNSKLDCFTPTCANDCLVTHPLINAEFTKIISILGISVICSHPMNFEVSTVDLGYCGGMSSFDQQSYSWSLLILQ